MMEKFTGKYELLNEILNVIYEFGISDDSERDTVIDNATYETLIKLKEINYGLFGELVEEYINLNREEKNLFNREFNELFYTCINFLNTITLARIEIENSSDSRHKRYSEYLEYNRLKN